MTRALLIGATGSSGLAVLSQADGIGVTVRALARNPARLREAAPDIRDVAQGDVLNLASLVAALEGVGCVISVLGTPLTLRKVTLLSEGTRNVVDAMGKVGVKRLVCVTGMGAGDSRGHGGLFYDRVILPTLLRSIYADKDRQERVVRASGLDWTIVRPARLTDGALTGSYRKLTVLQGERMTAIARMDVAHFLLEEATQGRYIRQTVNLT